MRDRAFTLGLWRGVVMMARINAQLEQGVKKFFHKVSFHMPERMWPTAQGIPAV